MLNCVLVRRESLSTAYTAAECGAAEGAEALQGLERSGKRTGKALANTSVPHWREARDVRLPVMSSPTEGASGNRPHRPRQSLR
jgi:hypothetical protein